RQGGHDQQRRVAGHPRRPRYLHRHDRRRRRGGPSRGGAADGPAVLPVLMNALLMDTAGLLLADARFPAGGHAHSGGIEPAATAGLVADLSSAEACVRGRRRTPALPAAALAAAACARATAATPTLDTPLVPRTPPD